MKRHRWLVAVLVLGFGLGAADAANWDRLYGKISTKDGEVFEGPIRWDRNEASWLDVLDGYKKLPERNRQAAARAGQAGGDRKEIRVLGIKIAEFDSDGEFSSSSSAGIRFGHIRTIEPISSSQARLILKSGLEVEISGSDVGSGVRAMVIEDKSRGRRELSWKDLEVVEFFDAPETFKSEFGERLYGTLLTKGQGGFTGLVCWDVDEIFTTDVLDGKGREIQFGEIASIQRESSRSARVTLKSGEEVVLSGTNDVNSDNRGILIMDPEMGAIRVDWERFEKLVLEPAPEKAALAFDGGRPLRGVVTTEGGESFSGLIRWDNDEEYGWELLDGEDRGVQFEIEFGRIGSIEKSSADSSVVKLRDGRSFELRGSNDVGADNRGIFVTVASGEEKLVSWKDFRKINFE